MPTNLNRISRFELGMICGIWDLDDEVIMATYVDPGANMISQIDQFQNLCFHQILA